MGEDFKKIFGSHHAFLIEGNNALALEVRDSLKDDNDLFFIEKDEVNMEDALLIRENAYLKPSFGDFRVLVVSAGKFGREAEQTMLKVLEEPPKETRIIIVTPNAKFLTPTILSRVLKVKGQILKSNKSVLDFVQKSHLERLKAVEIFLKDEDFNVINFLSNLELLIGEKKLTKDPLWRELLTDIYKAKEALQIGGTSKKQILEFLSLTMPKF